MQTTKRLKIAKLLCDIYLKILRHTYPSPEEKSKTLMAAVYLSTNAIAPQHAGVEVCGPLLIMLLKCEYS